MNEEFSEQNKLEMQYEHIPETPYYKNLDQPKVLAQGERNFITYVCLPYWRLMNQFFNNELSIAVNHLE